MAVDRGRLRDSYDANAKRRKTFPLPQWRVEARNIWVAGLPVGSIRQVVDLGGATGADAAAFSALGWSVTVVDLSPVHVEIAIESGLTAIEADVINTGLPDGAFDAAWSASTFMHLADGEFETALLEVARITRPGGAIQIGLWGGVDETTIWEDDFQDPARVFVHRSDHVVVAAASAAFEVLDFRTEQTGYRPDLHYQWIVGRRPS